jgi:hypothetical protein
MSKQWLQTKIEEFDLSNELFDTVESCIVTADEEGAKEVYDELISEIDNEEAIECFKRNKPKVIKGLISFIKDQLRDMNESTTNEFVTPSKLDVVKEIDTTGKPIQDTLSDRAFKHLYTFEELRQRTKKVQWINDQILAMIDKGEKINEIQKLVVSMKDGIKNLAEYYKKRYEVKLGYIYNQLKHLEANAK